MSLPTLTEKFVLECVRADSRNESISAIKNLEESKHSINWAVIATHGEKIAPFLYLRLNKSYKKVPVPPRISYKIKFDYLSQVKKNQEIKQMIRELTEKFTRAHIDLIFLKGAAHLMTVYKRDEGLRPMEDLDILIRKESLPKVGTTLRGIGYVEDYERLSKEFKGHLSRDYFEKKHFHYIYYKGRIRLELHWDIAFKHNPLTMQKLWEFSELIPIDGIKMRILNAEGSIFIACLNFNKDFSQIFKREWFQSEDARSRAFYYTIFFLYEIKQLLEYYKGKIVWDNFLLLAKSIKKEYELFTLLALAKRAVKARTPNIAMKNAKRDPFAFLYIFICQRMGRDNLYGLLMAREKISLMRKSPSGFIKILYGEMLTFFSRRNRLCYFFLKRLASVIKRITRKSLR